MIIDVDNDYNSNKSSGPNIPMIGRFNSNYSYNTNYRMRIDNNSHYPKGKLDPHQVSSKFLTRNDYCLKAQSWLGKEQKKLV